MLDLIYPPHCVHCDRVGSLLCSHCARLVVRAAPRSLDGLDAMLVYAEFTGPVRAAIHALKYESQRRMARILADWLAAESEIDRWSADLVTAIPLHSARLAARGYNQAGLLAKHFARERQLVFWPEAVERLRDTVSQVTLSATERRQNVDGAFGAAVELVQGKRVILVDDVLTTGATMQACAAALRAAGAWAVFGVAVAGAQFAAD